MKNLAIIPADSLNQKIRHLNIKLIAGHPLIYYQIECAKKIKEIDKIIVLTDNRNYQEIAKSLGVETIIGAQQIFESQRKENMILYAIDVLKQRGEFFDNVILLPPTNPLNKPEDLQRGIDALKSRVFKSASSYYDEERTFSDYLGKIKAGEKSLKIDAECFWIKNIKEIEINKDINCEPCAYIKVSKISALKIDSFENLQIIESLLEKDMRLKEKKYFKSVGNYNANYEDYYGPQLDPDGKLRDNTQEKEDKIEFCKEEIKFINEIVSDGKKRNFLDLGCGMGFTSSAISNNYNKYGLEISNKSAGLAKKYIENIHIGYLEENTYPEEFFDLVLSHHVIEHVENPIEFVRNIHKIMKTHGHLIIATPNFDSGMARRFGKNYRLLDDRFHISLFSDFSLKQLLEDFGFIVDKIEYPFFDTKYFIEENLLRVFDTSKVSPPFYGNIMTLYARKK